MKKFLINLQFIFRPSYWLMLRPYNKDIDKIMNHLLDEHEFSNIGEFTAFLGDVEIWIMNRPSNCMMPYEFVYKYRPSRLTILRGINKLGVKFIKKNGSTEINNFKKSIKYHEHRSKKPKITEGEIEFTPISNLPYCCPVCCGNGLVTNGFYTQVSGHWSSSDATPEMCRSCNGTGIVWG